MEMLREAQSIAQAMAHMLQRPEHGLLVLLLVLAAWSDLQTRRIPNALVFGGTLLGMVAQLCVPGTAGGLSALGGMAACLALMLPMYVLRAMGAGDVKLMVMVGAFLGLPLAASAALAVFLAGGVLALVYALCKGAIGKSLTNMADVVQGAALSLATGERPSLAIDAAKSAGRVPYALAIAVGTVGFLMLHQFHLV